jgi:hypothetical protein
MVTKEIYTPYGPIQGDHVMWWVIYQERKNVHPVWTHSGRPRNVVGDTFKEEKKYTPRMDPYRETT